MAFHTFGPGLALDEVTGRGIPAVVAQLTDAETGDPVQAYTMDDEPIETTVSTNRYGYFGQFQTADTVRRLRLTFGGLTLEHTAWELLTEAAQDAAEALQAALDALQAAQDAADLVGAPADEVMATAIKSSLSLTTAELNKKYLYEVNAVEWGVPNDGVTHAHSSILELLRDNQQIENIYFPAGTYLMGDQVSLARTKSLNVRCHPRAIFKFIANVATETNKKVMFQIFGDRAQGEDGSTDFTWSGGIIDGNDANQGDENLDSWDNYDKCKGMKIVRFRNAELFGVTVKEIRGHGVNHWNNKRFHAHDCTIDQAISRRKPVGGTRRDGISGSSDTTIYERITGFAADDLVAVSVGAMSPPKGFSGWSTWDADVDLFIAKDIRATSKTDHTSTIRHTWKAVSIHLLNGYKVKEARIEGVYGDTESGMLRFGGYQEGYYGSVESLSVSDVDGDSYGLGADGFISLSGSPDASSAVEFGKVSLRRINRSINRAGETSTNIRAYYANIQRLTLQDVSVEYGALNTMQHPLVLETGSTNIHELHANGVSLNDRANPTNPTLRIYTKNTTNSGRTRFFGAEINMGPRSNSSTRRVLNVIGTGSVVPFGFDVLVDYEHSTIIAEPGAHCTDRMVGAVLVDNGGSWKQVTKPANVWNQTSQGKPTSGLWKVGFENVVVGSPMGACIGYRCITEGVGSAASFTAISPTSMTDPSSLTLGFIPTTANTTPGTTISREIGSTEGASFPGGQAGIFTLYVGNISLAWTYETYQRRDTGQVYRRTWNGSSWTTWA